MTDVQTILRSLGITRCYKGFKHTEYAICLAIQDESDRKSTRLNSSH